MATPEIAEGVRKDVLWQQVETVRGYERSRPAVPFEQAEFDIVCQVLRAHGIVPDHLLDLGAGDGLAAINIMARMPVSSAVLVDFSEPMLEAARANFGASSADIQIVTGDLFDSSWSSGLPPRRLFDVIISRHAIHHLPDTRKKHLYGEVLTFLNPGGMFVNIEHVKSRSGGYQRAFDQVMVESIHAHQGGSTSLDDVLHAYRTRMDGELNILADVWDQAQWFVDLGYENVDVSFKALELAVICGMRPTNEDAGK